MTSTTTSTAHTSGGTFEPTREQDAFAEAMAMAYDSVEVRRLSRGEVIVCIARNEGEPGFARHAHVTPDGVPMTDAEVIDFRAREYGARGRLLAFNLPWSFFGDAAREQECRAFAAEAMHAYPQYDGAFVRHYLARAEEPFATKGGMAYQEGDAVLVDPEGDKPLGYRRVFSLRRLGHVECPSVTLRRMG